MKKSKIKALRALADHPETPKEEAASARRILESLSGKEESDACGRTYVRYPEMPTSMSEAMSSMFRRVKRKGAGNFRNAQRSVPFSEEIPVRDRWPDGWGEKTTEEEIEHEREDGSSGDVWLGWKCPNCGDQVSKYFPEELMGRISRLRDGGSDRYIKEWLCGVRSQLCNKCWEKLTYNGR